MPKKRVEGRKAADTTGREEAKEGEAKRMSGWAAGILASEDERKLYER